MTKLRMKIFETDVEYEGNETFVRNGLPRALEMVTASHNGHVKETLLGKVEELQQTLASMDGSHESTSRLREELDRMIDQLHEKTESSLAGIEQLADIPADVLQWAKRMKEQQALFNLQYLQLKGQVQDENRRFVTVSNVMRAKHDEVRNSVNNIR